MLTGKLPEIEREVLLYFDNVYLQCARWKSWKLHMSRYNSAPYSAAPQGGRKNLPLPAPELYNLSLDPDESYDVAPEHPHVVKEILARVEKLLPSFPDDVQKAWVKTKERPTQPTPTGQYPRAKPNG
jgi:arylsulfatase